MADPVPAANRALLAAQAKGGQAGVDAYNAAKQELEGQRSAAVQQAMQEAALRGAPRGAIPSISSTITSPYDMGIAQMTEGSANYQADMARTNQRMANYQAGVQAARSFIPLQTEQTLAPMRMQEQFDLEMQRMRGDQSLEEIRARTELELAQMRAAQEAAARKAKQDEMKLTQTESANLLTGTANDYISGTEATLAKDLGANEAAVSARTDAAQKPSAQMLSAQDQAHADTTLAYLSRAYGGRGIATAKADALARAAAQTVSPDLAQTNDRVFMGPNGQPFRIPGPPVSSTSAQELADQRRRAMQQMENDAAVRRGEQAYEATQGRIDATTAREHALFSQRMGAIGTAFDKAYGELSSQDKTSGNRIMLSKSQLQGLDPYQQQMVSALLGGGNILSPEDLATASGDPTADINATLSGRPSNAGIGSPTASAATQIAYQQALQELMGRGYQIGPENLPTQFPSLYDAMAAAGNRPEAEKVYNRAIANQTAAETAQGAATEAGAKQQKAAAAAWAAQFFGKPLTAAVGDPVQVASLFVDPASGQVSQQAASDFAAIIAELNTLIAKAGNAKLDGRALLQAYAKANPEDLGQPGFDQMIRLALWKLGYSV